MPIYQNIVDGEEVEEYDDALQQRLRNLPNLPKVVRIIKDNSDYSLVSHDELQRTEGKIILEKNGQEISLLLRHIKNSGDNRGKKRWQVYKDLVYEERKTNYLLGIYSTGDSYIFTLSDEDEFVRNYATGENGNYTSSWIAYDGLIKDCALKKDSMLTGLHFKKKNSTNIGFFEFRKDL